MSTRNYDHLFKIVVVGNYDVGKTSIHQRFFDNSFSAARPFTLGIDFRIKTIALDLKRVKLQIWDTTPTPRCKAITLTYYRGTHGILIVYDITNQRSFEDVGHWLDQIANQPNTEIVKLLVGNKCDLSSERVVEYDTAKSFADQHGLTLIETSAKDGTNVEQAFIRLAAEVKRKVDLSPDSGDGRKRVETNSRTADKRRCVCS